jgi:hypothetical protein
VRIWVGTRKGAYRVDGTTGRRRWTVHGPFDNGSDVFHAAPDPRHPGTVYSAVNNGWWGPALRRSKDGGKTWKELPLPGMLPIRQRTPPVEAPSATAPIKNLWHIEPGHPSEPTTVFLGIDPGMLFRSDDGGNSWTGVPGLNDHPTRSQWNPGAGGMCTHTILIDPDDPKRMYVGISAAGSFRSDDGGERWTPINHGVETPYLPVKYPEIGQCVHKMALDPGDPSRLFRQDHGGIYVSRNRGDSWTRIGRPLEDDFGFVLATSPTLPGDAFFAPLSGESRTMLGRQFQVYRWQGAPKRWTPLVRKGAYPGAYGTHREGLAADGLDPAGLYLGTTTGQLFVSPNAGKEWVEVPYQFPGIHSVEVSDGRPAA